MLGVRRGTDYWERVWGHTSPALWVAAFCTSDRTSGDNDLTCLQEPLAAAGIWGWGGVLGARQRGAQGLRTPPPCPPAWLPPSKAACGLALEQGTDLPRGWHWLSGGLFLATVGKARGADVGLTSRPAPHLLQSLSWGFLAAGKQDLMLGVGEGWKERQAEDGADSTGSGDAGNVGWSGRNGKPSPPHPGTSSTAYAI